MLQGHRCNLCRQRFHIKAVVGRRRVAPERYASSRDAPRGAPSLAKLYPEAQERRVPARCRRLLHPPCRSGTSILTHKIPPLSNFPTLQPISLSLLSSSIPPIIHFCFLPQNTSFRVPGVAFLAEQSKFWDPSSFICHPV